MKKIVLCVFLMVSAVALYAHGEVGKNVSRSSYDMPIKCKMCGQWHLPGAPCKK